MSQQIRTGQVLNFNAGVIGSTLTGYSSGSGTISSADTILGAIQKLNGNVSALTGAVIYQGTWNANTNSPSLASGTGTKGFYYKVSVAGSTTIDTISQWNVGDTIIFDGTVWDKIDGVALEVISVFGRTGAVVATSGDYTTAQVTESGSLYFTNARAIASTLTGYTSGAGTVSATDSILQAIQKLNGNIVAISGANPSVNVTLSVQNGVATTFMRSDAAPALSQAIIPTWTGAHTFQGGIFQSGNVSVASWSSNTATSATGVSNNAAAATYTDTSTANSTTLTWNYIEAIKIPTIAATNTAIVYTNAITFYIAGAPANGTNVTITNPYSFYIAAGAAFFGGHLTVEGVTSTGATGTGKFVFDNSPTFTGTVVIPTPFTLGAVSVTSTGTQLNYLSAATGTTGTTSSTIVFSISPALTGTPTAPTATVGTNTTQIATTAFVTTNFIGYANYIVRETPSGSINSSNVTFTLANTPKVGSEMVYQNGLLQAVTVDYTISGGTITYLVAPTTGDTLVVTYTK